MTYRRRPVLYLALVNVPGVLAMVFLAFGVGAAGLAIRSEVLLWQMLRRGVEVQGEVKGFWVKSHSCGTKSRDTCETHEVEVAFRDARGEEQRERVKIGEAMYAGLRRGGPVAVHLLPGDPVRVVVDMGQLREEAAGAGTLSAVVLAVSVAIAVYRLRKAQRMVWVRDFGVIGTAKVVLHETSNEKINGISLYRAIWQDEDGHSGRTEPRWQSFLPAVGTTILVSRDPGGTRGAVWHGDTGSPKR